MKNKIQQKIYAIYQSFLSYASKLRISSFVGGQFKRRQNKFNLDDLDTNERNKIMATIKEVASELGEKIIDLGTKVVIIDVIQSDINKLVETKTKKKLSVETKLKIVDEIEIYVKSKKQLITESEDYDILIDLVNELKNRIKNGK